MKPSVLEIPGDFSSAAFLIVAVLITKNSKLVIKNVGLNFFRTGLLDVLNDMKAKISVTNKKVVNGELVGDIHVKSSQLISTSVKKTLVPRLIDELPILFVAASFAKGTSSFFGLEELKFKESDRLSAMATALKNSGVTVEQKTNSLKISGKSSQVGGNFVKTFKDHRIAMSMLVFGLASENNITVDDEKMIKTSFPNFKEILNSVGAKIEFVQK